MACCFHQKAQVIQNQRHVQELHHGLSLGLACCLLIVLYAKDELSFDRFQKNGANLYRITCHIINKQRDRDERYGLAGMTQGPSFHRSIPEIKTFIRTKEDDFILRRGTETFAQKATWVDSNFFSVFSFPLLSGSPATVLADPHSVVLTEDMAKKYFGTTNARLLPGPGALAL